MPNIFIYDLKSFKSIEVLKRLAGEIFLNKNSRFLKYVNLIKHYVVLTYYSTHENRIYYLSCMTAN